jgi:hypothetical protein
MRIYTGRIASGAGDDANSCLLAFGAVIDERGRNAIENRLNVV